MGYLQQGAIQAICAAGRMRVVAPARSAGAGKYKGVIWLSATRFRRSYFLCFGGADRMAFASCS